MWQRPVWASIDLASIKNNLLAIKKNLKPNIAVCAVVKADAYGHGALPVAMAALECGANMLAVAILAEALELRLKGVTAPVLVLGFTPPSQAHLVAGAGITQTIYSKDAALALSAAAVNAKTKIKVHLKIDTGMGRIGLEPKDAADFACFVSNLPGLALEGVFSHFAAADSPDKSYTLEQFCQFQEVLETIKAKGVDIPVKHIANSAAALDLPQTHLDMVRVGLAMYGLWPSPEIKQKLEPGISLKPAMSLNAQIVHLKDVPAGRSISYARTYFTPETKKIATLPIGYADGFARGLSGKTGAIINEKFAPLVGRICMDQCMVDVSGAGDVKIGDSAVLFGHPCLTIDEVAAQIDTINYELICMVGKRVPRIYK